MLEAIKTGFEKAVLGKKNKSHLLTKLQSITFGHLFQLPFHLHAVGCDVDKQDKGLEIYKTAGRGR